MPVHSLQSNKKLFNLLVIYSLVFEGDQTFTNLLSLSIASDIVQDMLQSVLLKRFNIRASIRTLPVYSYIVIYEVNSKVRMNQDKYSRFRSLSEAHHFPFQYSQYSMHDAWKWAKCEYYRFPIETVWNMNVVEMDDKSRIIISKCEKSTKEVEKTHENNQSEWPLCNQLTSGLESEQFAENGYLILSEATTYFRIETIKSFQRQTEPHRFVDCELWWKWWHFHAFSSLVVAHYFSSTFFAVAHFIGNILCRFFRRFHPTFHHTSIYIIQYFK